MQEVDKTDLLYNYNLQYIIIKEKLLDKELIKNIDDRKIKTSAENPILKFEIGVRKPLFKN